MDPLFESLFAHFRRQYAPMVERDARLREMSDEEYLASHRSNLSHMPHFVELSDEQLLSLRGKLLFDEAKASQLAHVQATELRPYVESLRQESGRTGPATDDEIVQAATRRTLGSIEQMTEKMKSAAANLAGTRRGEILAALAGNAEDDLTDLESLSRDATEEHLRAITARIVARTQDLTERFLRPH